MADVAMPQLSEADQRKQLNRAVIASAIGSTIEWYDFFLYSTVTGLVFAKLYFPQSDPAVGILQAFSIYFVGFLARPVGAAIFGHYGDRIGRKGTLVATLLLMGIATFLVGLVPSYEVIGIWGAIILTALRFIQGIGVGGEWGGAVLLAMEWAKTDKHRGFVTSWPQWGVPMGVFTANLAVYVFAEISGDAFLDWGWRIPFLLSILLVGVGLYIRLGILETPTFRKLEAENKIERQPMIQALKEHPREILLSAFARTGQQSAFYIFTAFIFVYGTAQLGLERNDLLRAVMVCAAVSCITIPLFGWLSDRWGRRRTYLTGAVLLAVFSFAYFAALDTRVPLWVFLAIIFSLPFHDIMFGPQAALIAECFKGRLRYSGSSMGYQLASVFAGGPAPLIATYLLQKTGSGFAIAAYLAVGCVISFVSVLMMTDRTNRALLED
ncbi:MAG: MFS transporter [Rhodospirillaceae bacterium]